MFKRFFIIEQNSEIYKYVFPTYCLTNKAIEEPFLFPCSDIIEYQHNIFVVVLTEVDGSQNFLISKYIDNGKACICFQSNCGWFELLYTAMYAVIRANLYRSNKRRSLEEYLTSLTLLPSPLPGLVIYIPGADSHDTATKVVVPTKLRQKPFSVFITEMRTRMQFEDWLIIFESLLLEKWIVFHSHHLDRVTNCIFAALSLIFPLEWVHLIFPCLSEASINCLGCPSPYIAGVHSCLIERVYPLLGDGAVVVDIDQRVINYVCTENVASDDDDKLPKTLMNFLWRTWSSCDMKIIASKRRGNEEESGVTQIVSGFLHVIAFLLGKYNRCKMWDCKTGRYYVDKASLSSSRGEMFESFISKLLQSQMVHQFLDDRINAVRIEDGDSLKITLNDIDDFVEACHTMDRWQPDHYTDTIVNIASKSKRQINVLANKVLDMAKIPEFGSKSQYTDTRNRKFTLDPDDRVNTPISAPKIQTPIANNNEVIHRDNWINFEDNSPRCAVNLENVVESVNELADLLTFDEWEPVVSIQPDRVHNMNGIIRDFDPLFQN